MKPHIAVLLAGLLVSCGGGGGSSTGASASGSGGGGALAGVAGRVEESDPAVTLRGTWAPSDSAYGWSGGSAVQSGVAGATASVAFSGTSIRWLGSRGRAMGIALVSVDGGPAKEVDLFARPVDEAHSDIVTISDLSNGPHTLTITVTGRQNTEAQGNVVVVDGFDVQPSTTVSHWQDTDPNAHFSAGWTKSAQGFPWSGSGVSNPPELPVTAQETTTTGATVTLPFRGTAISWIGYVGPDGGIATAQIDGGAPTQVDTYSPTAKYQPVVFMASGLADTNHTLTITATGQKNPASTSARIVVDAWDVMTPGRRYEEGDPSITFTGRWDPRDTRVWSEGHSLVSNETGATATFSFTGTSVSWIGCEKASASGRARIYLDGVFQREVYLGQSYPIEGYQMTIFRADGLANGPHTLTIEVVNTDGGYVVVDAFDVR
jgi:hypothetical protein